MLYLLDIFDGKISVEEIKTTDLKLISEMQKIQEAKIKAKVDEIKANKASEANGKDNYVNNSGKKYKKKDNGNKF